MDTAVKVIGLVCLLIFAGIVVGCAGGARVRDAADVNTGAVVGQIKADVKTDLTAEGNRIIGVSKEIQKHTYERLDHATQTIGTSSRDTTWIVLIFCCCIGWCDWVRARFK